MATTKKGWRSIDAAIVAAIVAASGAVAAAWVSKSCGHVDSIPRSGSAVEAAGFGGSGSAIDAALKTSTGRAVSGSQQRKRRQCTELQRCDGLPVRCFVAHDDVDPTKGWQIVTDDHPIVYGPWINTECGTKGDGWYMAGLGTCGDNKGPGNKRCSLVTIETSDPRCNCPLSTL